MNDSPTYDIFVYGTLRQSGTYHHLYLRYCRCLHAHYTLPGYALYDYAGQYPFMVPEVGGTVVGDVFRINETTRTALDEFEDVRDGLYHFVYLPKHQFYTYLKLDPDVANMPRVPGGNWLTYCSGE